MNGQRVPFGRSVFFARESLLARPGLESDVCNYGEVVGRVSTIDLATIYCGIKHFETRADEDVVDFCVAAVILRIESVECARAAVRMNDAVRIVKGPAGIAWCDQPLDGWVGLGSVEITHEDDGIPAMLAR